jgi:hypothetical protein
MLNNIGGVVEVDGLQITSVRALDVSVMDASNFLELKDEEFHTHIILSHQTVFYNDSDGMFFASMTTLDGCQLEKVRTGSYVKAGIFHSVILNFVFQSMWGT